VGSEDSLNLSAWERKYSAGQRDTSEDLAGPVRLVRSTCGGWGCLARIARLYFWFRDAGEPFRGSLRARLRGWFRG